MKTAYIVMGDTGEYSDHCSWYLKCFTDKAMAEGLCNRLNAWLKERGLDYDSKGHRRYSLVEDRPPEDPDFRCDYTGSQYSILELPLEIAKRIKTVR